MACTPPSEVLSNDLIKEFSDRCTSASKSIQGYMTAENPAPDNDTMESLIDTNEQLQQALNHHRRAVLQAKKQLGLRDGSSGTSSPAPHPHQQQSPPPAQSRAPPPVPSRSAVAGSSSSNGNGNGNSNGKGKATLDAYSTPAIAGPSRSASGTPRHDTDDDDDEQDPFRDPPTEHQQRAAGSSSRPDGPPRLSFEPFHPGFGGSSSLAAGASAGAAADKRKEAEPVTPVSDDESDAYRATPKKEGHVFRY